VVDGQERQVDDGDHDDAGGEGEAGVQQREPGDQPAFGRGPGHRSGHGAPVR
jgi:hypothetical protein